MSEDQDETLERIVAALRPLPMVDESAKARVLVAVATEREREREHGRSTRPGRRVRWSALGIGIAAAAAWSVFVLRGTDGLRSPADQPLIAVPAQPVAPPNGATGATLAAHAAGDASALQSVQLVLRAPDAHRVSVVGDFTAWDAQRAEMTRDARSGLWSVTVALQPGRHVYAFVVDDSIWLRDPRAPVAPDADFGRPGSVLLVGRP